jgi:5-methylcytosine-specific restriction protein A
MSRRKFTKKDRARIFTANAGCCHLCKGAITVGEAWEIEHVIAWELTRDDSDDNLRPAHVGCHKHKTHTEDRPAINKAKRREGKHSGTIRPKQTIRSAPFPASDKSIKRQDRPSLPPRQLFGAQP